MRVVVDRDRCEGNAVCVGIAPDLFVLDDDDYVMVTKDPIPADEEALAEQAIANAPRRADAQGLEVLPLGAAEAGLDLTGRVAVVTGAAAGLGRAESIGLARSGATVIVNDMPQSLEASDVLDAITATGSGGVAVAGDVSQRSTADELLRCAESLGGLDIVVNNAGITRDRMLFNMSDEDWDAVIAVHLRGHFLLTRNAATYWRAKAKANRRVGLRPDHQYLLGSRVSVRWVRRTMGPPRPASQR